jgi:serine phosphatase RsbU (regulator of sigma subunit)
LLRTLHEALLQDEGSADRFCTVCCGLLRLSDARIEMSLSCGGHPLPIVARATGEVQTVECRGTLLGLRGPVKLQDQTIRLDAGDVVVLFTDGAIEAHRSTTDLFGEERLAEIIGASASLSADEIADRILSAVVAFGPSEPRDDIAIVVAKLRPEGAAASV